MFPIFPLSASHEKSLVGPSLTSRVEQFRQLQKNPRQATTLQAPSSLSTTTSLFSICRRRRWSSSELWMDSEMPSQYTPMLPDDANRWVKAALRAVTSCKAADSLNVVTYPGIVDGPSSGKSFSQVACGVLCGQYRDNLSFVNALIDTVLARCLVSPLPATTTSPVIDRRDYALRLLRHVRSVVFPMMLAANSVSEDEEVTDFSDGLFPRAWKSETQKKVNKSSGGMSQRKHAIRCVASRALDDLISFVEARLRKVQGQALNAVRVRLYHEDAAAKAVQQKSKNAKKSAILKVRTSTTTGIRDAAAAATVALSAPQMTFYSKLLQQLRDTQVHSVAQGAYTNLSVVFREVEWLLLTSVFDDGPTPSTTIARLAYEVSDEWKNVSLASAVSSFASDEDRDANEATVPGKTLHVADHAATHADSASHVALQILDHLETSVDKAQLFAYPFWRLSSASSLDGSNAINGCERYDCTMLMRQVLHSSTNTTTTNVGGHDGGFCTHATSSMLLTPLGCYDYLCAALENIVDDCVALFGPEHERSKLAEAMRRELTTRAISCGLLQR